MTPKIIDTMIDLVHSPQGDYYFQDTYGIKSERYDKEEEAMAAYKERNIKWPVTYLSDIFTVNWEEVDRKFDAIIKKDMVELKDWLGKVHMERGNDKDT